MQVFFTRFWLALWLSLTVFVLSPVHAQNTTAEISANSDDDRGFITNFLQEKLSGAGRVVNIEGFQGALSSRATFTRMTIADDQGIWIALENGSIQWTRSALLARRVQIQELSAEKVTLPRLPGGDPQKPTAEATPFALPVLPVSVNIDKISIGRVELGEPVIGIAATASVQGAMNLANGEGVADLTINRLDGPRGVFALKAGFSNETRILDLDLNLDEDRDGLFANLVDLYDKPSVKAEIKGHGPLSEFAADMKLATNGQDRVTGRIALHEAQLNGKDGTNFNVDIGGDIASILRPDQRDFFGTRSQMLAQGWVGPGGQLDIPSLKIETDALNLTGMLTTTDKGAPQSANFQLNLGEDAQAKVLPVSMPFADKPTTVRSGSLALTYDAAQDSGWTLKGRIGDVTRDEGKLQELRIDGRGKVNLNADALDSIRGWVAFGMDGLVPADPGLAQAVGDVINGGLNFEFRPGNALRLWGMNVNGNVYGLKGDMTVSGLSSGIGLSGDMVLAHRDLSKGSLLAARDLSGQAEAHIVGSYTLLSKAFDVNADIKGTDITVDQENADRLLAGQSTIQLSARRDEKGIDLRNLTVNAQALTVAAKGFLNSNASGVKARISMADLSVAAPDMSGQAELTADVTGPDGRRKITINGQAVDLVTGIQELDGLLKGATALNAEAVQDKAAFELQTLSLTNPQVSLSGNGSFAEGALDATVNLSMQELEALNRGLGGKLDLVATATEQGGIRQIKVEGTGQNLRLGQQDVGNALTGETKLNLLAEENAGTVTIRDFKLDNAQMNASAKGVIGRMNTDLTGQLDIRSLASFGRGWRGALKAQGSFVDDGSGGRVLNVTGTGNDLALGMAQVDGVLAGATTLAVKGIERAGVFTIDTATVNNARLNIDATGKVGGGQTDLNAQLRADDLRFLGRGFRGALKATAHATEAEGRRNLTLEGTANGLGVGNPQADALLAGQTAFNGAVSLDAQDRLSIQSLRAQNSQFNVTADGDPANLNINARLNDLAQVAPGFPGAVEVRGTVGQTADQFRVNLNATAPGDLRAQIEGTVASDFSRADISARGTGDAALANPALRTRAIEGPVSFDLRLNGAPSLEALSGTVRLTDARLAEPKLGLSLEALNANAAINAGRILLDVRGNVESGGSIIVNGPISLTGSQAIDLNVGLQRIVLRDPNLYQITANGGLTVTGTLGAGPLVAGKINIWEAELRIPSTGFGGAEAIPPIKHLFDRPPVRATRAKAGLIGFPSAEAAAAGMNAPAATPPANPARFDLLISAPRQVFVRGRGVDAEFGGEIRITGDARSPIPVGQLELIRGRVDLLGKRFDLVEGLIEMQGSLIPVIRLAAITSQDGITTTIIIDGEARDPEISFEASPEMPEEEVLSHLLFGRGLDTISPLQAAQLANAIAVLAGRGGESIVGRLRASTGLDDLDLATDNEGNVSVRAGKYLSKNLYTDVQVGADGDTKLNLNLDLSRSTTARGTIDSTGNSSVGIFYERDY